MEYGGKSLDGFEYAFSTLLKINGANTDPLPSLDCLSFRSFAFSGSGTVKEWFRPTAEWSFYLPVLAGNLNCVNALEVRNAWNILPDEFQEWTLVGEAPYPDQRVSPQSKFYSGAPTFFLCRKVPGRDKMMVCDPMGVPCNLVELDKLCAGLRRSNGFIALFRERPAVCVRSAEEILDQALAWREVCGQNIAAKGFPIAELYHGGTREQISLRYGLMNCHVQMGKTVRFFSNAGLLSASVSEQLMRMLSDLHNIWQNSRFELLHQLDETLWTALREAR